MYAPLAQTEQLGAKVSLKYLSYQDKNTKKCDTRTHLIAIIIEHGEINKTDNIT